jgi:apolipoprotein N-acyltransferase
MTPQTALSFPGILQALSPTPILLTGGSYYPSEDCVFNSLFVQLPNAPLQHIYAKKHLLPFGEYIPHRSFLSHFFPSHWLQKVTPGSRDFTRGTSCELTYVPHVPPFRTLICYEAIFPEEVCLPGGKRPQWLLNITNDGWFGHSPGPYQHFASARFRAIEQGVPLVRVANTGISAIVDPVGRIVHALPLYFQGVLDGFLPASLSPTFYARHGNTVWWIMVVALSGFLGLLWVQRKRKNPL